MVPKPFVSKCVKNIGLFMKYEILLWMKVGFENMWWLIGNDYKKELFFSQSDENYLFMQSF